MQPVYALAAASLLAFLYLLHRIEALEKRLNEPGPKRSPAPPPAKTPPPASLPPPKFKFPPSHPVEKKKDVREYQHVGLLSRNNGETADLFGKRERRNAWRYFAKTKSSRSGIPVVIKDQNCFTSRWPKCGEVYVGDRVRLIGDGRPWTVANLWTTSCTWKGDELECQLERPPV